jgi:aminopeptidase N
MKLTKLILLLLTVNIAASAQQKPKPVPVEPGVSYQLAQYRHSVMSDIQYTLDFVIPTDKDAKY